MTQRYRTRTVVVEVYGGPSSGKSTIAADIYAALKRRHVDAELSREVAKQWVWEGRSVGSFDELYILGAQIREEARLLGQAEVVVTDRPVLMSSVYCHLYAPTTIRDGVDTAVAGYYAESAAQGYARVAVMLPRRHRYVAAGRYEDEEAARLVDAVTIETLGTAIRMEQDYRDYPIAGVAYGYSACSGGMYAIDEACQLDDVVVDVSRWVAKQRRLGGRHNTP